MNEHNLKPFKKGESGNVKGRPKIPDIKGVLQEQLNTVTRGKTDLQHVIEALVKRAKAGDISAIRELFDRTYGKSKLFVDTSIQPQQIIHVLTLEDKLELEKI